MGKPLIEKIIAQHTAEPVEAGRIVWMDLDVRSARDFAGANVVKNYRTHYNGTPVADASKTMFTFDCNVPANTIPYANNQQICRVFAREQNLKVFDVNAGIGSHVMIDEGLCGPGDTVVGTDSHLNILGAIGCFGQGMGDLDIAFAFKTGRTWFEVPETIRITLTGNPSPQASAKDMILAVLRHMGPNRAIGRAVEFYGPAVDALTLDGRITFASMVTEMSGIIGLLVPSDSILDELRALTGRTYPKMVPDTDVAYVDDVVVDVDNLPPLIACPPSPTDVVPVNELPKVVVDSIFIGSCTNGRGEDLRLVAQLVRGHRVASHVMAKIVPATRKIYSELLRDGTLNTLFEAGFIISHPGCGGCASGQIGMTGKGEVQVSTSNRNFAGKQGDGDTYLASPATAAASALAGYITSAQ